jgi:hypothetical protein
MADHNDRLVWHKSSRCDSGTCVEIAMAGDEVCVRRSTSPDGPWLTFPREAWAEFLEKVKAGTFDPA